ncbi:NFACT RNA binding domain-containing protein [Algoriphagus limi]|uniref:NFACT RNA binding domain-containing protein n=1 Tax=Algoriphagus limi TaxID=2975273 RepID=A0ABT2G1I7_9BACT|nr:NFACT RNA binding domain-containing protein [Algoriphagus limi]MCS5489140.1 NFACT RNA binding domain-containing protein [Algoriphagus limi]
MHLNFHFLRFLCPRLQEVLTGFEITACFSQNKDELVIEFQRNGKFRYLRAHFLSPHIYYSFPENFQRAKRNSINLFPELIGEKVVSCKALNYERAFYLQFESGATLLLKLHGNRSNVLFYQPNEYQPLRVFRNEFQEDHTLDWRSLEKNLNLSQDRFLELEGNASQFLPTLGKIPREWLKSKGYLTANLEERWQLMLELIDMLESPIFSLVKKDEEVYLSLLPEDKAIAQFSDPIDALNELFYKALVVGAFEKEKRQLIKHFSDQLKRTENYLKKAKGKLQELETSPPPSQLADVIMANLHVFQDGNLTHELFNFYTQEPIRVELKPKQKPQDLAAQLYRKSKNRQIELDQLRESIESKEFQKIHLEDLLEELGQLEDFRALKEFKKNHGQETKISKEPENIPFKHFHIDGMDVWVGKSAKDNDEMLRSFVHKNDTWLHARQAAGSHVIIRNASGKIIPKTVLERAASLAAYYSKLKNESLAPVIYTEAKYVRKVKGSAPGMVLVDRESTILVKPQGPSEEIAK